MFPMRPLSATLKALKNLKVFSCLQGVEEGGNRNNWVNQVLVKSSRYVNMALAKIYNFRIFKKITPNGCFCRKTYFKLGQNLKLERAYLWKTGYACVLVNLEN